MIRYHDSITWRGSDGTDRGTFPANVYGTDGSKLNSGGIVLARLSLRAMVPSVPDKIDAVADRIAWRGMSLRLVGMPIPRMQRGTVHHYTIELEAIT